MTYPMQAPSDTQVASDARPRERDRRKPADRLRLNRDEWYEVVAAVIVSRALIIIGATFAPIGMHPQSEIALPSLREWLRQIYSTLFVTDSGWYMSIATGGYAPGPYSALQEQNWGFFPLYPLLVASVARTIPITLGYTALAFIGVLISNIAFFATIILLYRITKDEFNSFVARNAIWLLALFPVSYFLSGFRPESVFLLLSVLTYWEARHERWWLAGLAGALAAAARLQGILVCILILGEGLSRYGWQWRRMLPVIGACVLTAAGLVAFMAYMWWLTGDALAFSDIQRQQWGHDLMFPLSPLLAFLKQPFLVGVYGWDFGVLNFVLIVTALVAACYLAVIRRFTLAIYAICAVLAPLASTPHYGSAMYSFQGDARYVLVIFPMYPAIARWLEQRQRVWVKSTLALSAGLLGMLTLFVALGSNAAAV